MMMIVVGWLAVIIEYTVCIYSLVYMMRIDWLPQSIQLAYTVWSVEMMMSALTEYTVGVYSLVCA